MKLLFAAPDRDLLSCCRKLLETDLGETVTAFDGTHVFFLLASERFDIVILDRELPRVEHKKILLRIQQANTPVIVLTDAPVSAHQLTQEPLPAAFLPYPFSAGRLTELIRDTRDKASSGEHLSCAGLEIDVAGFRITGGPRLTGWEIDVLKKLLHGDSVTDNDGTAVSALNLKLARAGSKARIIYRPTKGFELVNEDE